MQKDHFVLLLPRLPSHLPHIPISLSLPATSTSYAARQHEPPDFSAVARLLGGDPYVQYSRHHLIVTSPPTLNTKDALIMAIAESSGLRRRCSCVGRSRSRTLSGVVEATLASVVDESLVDLRRHWIV